MRSDPSMMRAPKCATRGGFTLLEMCIVLGIIAILLGALMPALQSAFEENALRSDTRQVTLMVKTAMLQASDQHRTYVIDLTADSADLHPAGPESAPGSSSTPDASDSSDASGDSSSDAVTAACRFDSPDKLWIPDPNKRSAWIHLPATSWIFEPETLCPATPIRFTRGSSWIEMSFNPLTGNVETETSYFP